MSKYWLMVALLGAVGCSGASAEDAGSDQQAVSHGADADKAKPSSETPPTKVTEPGTDCDAQLAQIADMTKGVTDPAQLALLKEKYAQLSSVCPPNTGEPGDKQPPTKAAEPGADCDAELAKIADMTQGVTDPAQLALLKEKYEAVRSSCQAPAASCEEVLANLADATQGVTDPAQLALLKEKYEALRSSCQAPAADPGDKNPPTKDGESTDKPPTKDGEPATNVPVEDEPTKPVK